MITRRRALTGLAVGGGAVLAGGAAIRTTGLWPGPAMAAAPRPLAIPPLLRGEVRDGARVFEMSLKRGRSQFFDGMSTPTIGINGAYLGPTLAWRRGERVRMQVTNDLGTQSTLHWHGVHLPARADGGPHQVIAPGATWSPEFEVRQPAATVWYHSHMLHRTAEQVWFGLAGMIYLTDAESEALDLPQDYGVDDIPVVVQDRAFGRGGELIYSSGMHNRMMGATGGTLLVNGTINPTFEARSDRLRLRLLNGSNARSYAFGFDDGRGFEIVASDGGLLAAPYRTRGVTLAPGERAEIVVDLSDGRPATLRSNPPSAARATGGGMGGMMGRMMGGDATAFDVLRIVPSPDRRRAAPALPDKLAALPAPDSASAVGTRQMLLDGGGMGGMMMGGGFTIDGRLFDMNRIDARVRAGTSEIWEIENRSPLAHPMHIHDVQFRILDRDGRPPVPAEAGLKDTVLVAPGERVRLLLRFANYADPEAPYMYHCHILEHEDAGMMGQFVVTG